MNPNPEFLTYAIAFLVFIATPLWTAMEMYKDYKKHSEGIAFVWMTGITALWTCGQELELSGIMFEAIKQEHLFTANSLVHNLLILATPALISIAVYIAMSWIAFSKKAGEIANKLP